MGGIKRGLVEEDSNLVLFNDRNKLNLITLTDLYKPRTQLKITIVVKQFNRLGI